MRRSLIDNVEKSAVAQDEVRHVSPSRSQAPHGGFALPGFMNKPSSNTSTKRASPSTYAHSEASNSPTSVASAPAYDLGFRRPSIPSSLNTNRSPSFTSLARPWSARSKFPLKPKFQPQIYWSETPCTQRSATASHAKFRKSRQQGGRRVSWCGPYPGAQEAKS